MYFLLYFKSIVFFLTRAEGGVPDCFIFRLMLCVSDPLSLQFCYSFEKMAWKYLGNTQEDLDK